MPDQTPRGPRPTQSVVIRSLFDRLGPVENTRVLELFAGTGSVGIRALEAGAEQAVFVEMNRSIVRELALRLRKKGLEARATVLHARVKRSLKLLSGRYFDWCFADPPYGFEGLEEELAGLEKLTRLVILEQSVRDKIPRLTGFVLEKTARLRDVRLGFYRGLPGQL